MRSDMVLHVRKLRECFRALKAPKASVLPQGHRVNLVEGPPLLVLFFDSLRFFSRFIVFLLFTGLFVALHILKAAFPAAIKSFQIPVCRLLLQLCR